MSNNIVPGKTVLYIHDHSIQLLFVLSGYFKDHNHLLFDGVGSMYNRHANKSTYDIKMVTVLLLGRLRVKKTMKILHDKEQKQKMGSSNAIYRKVIDSSIYRKTQH